MQRSTLRIVCLFALAAPAAFVRVSVSSPSNGATVPSPVHYVASATSTCSKGISSMGIYTAPYVLAYLHNGDTLNTDLNLSSGTYDTVVEEWDYCGGATTTPIKITNPENLSPICNAAGAGVNMPRDRPITWTALLPRATAPVSGWLRDRVPLPLAAIPLGITSAEPILTLTRYSTTI